MQLLSVDRKWIISVCMIEGLMMTTVKDFSYFSMLLLAAAAKQAGIGKDRHHRAIEDEERMS